MHDFDAVYREFQPRISGYLHNLAGQEAAPDLTQEVFLKVSRALAGFREESLLSTWIYRIATNVAYDHFASSASRMKRFELYDDPASLDNIPDTVNSKIDSEYIRNEMNACIRSIVNQLPENYRAVLLLSDFEEFTIAEIAEILDISADNAKIRLHRARKALRGSMENQCDFYHDEQNGLMCDRKPK